MNFFKLYIGDYQRDTGTLTLSEHGAYLLMLQHYYATEQPLPTGKELHRLLRAENKAEREAIDSVVSRFWHATEQGLINERALEEIKKGQHQRAVNQEIGKRGGRPKKTDSVTHSDMGSVGDSVSDSVSENKTDSITDSVSKNNRKANRSETLTRHQTPDLYSVPDGTGQAPQTKDELWKAGKSLLTQSGMPVAQCGSFIGKLVKDYGAEAVLAAVREAIVVRPADPGPYIAAICKNSDKKPGKQSKRENFATKTYGQGVSEDGFLKPIGN